MSFESGAISFRMFYAPPSLPDDALDRFAQQSMPSLKGMGSGEVGGWVGGRHYLDVPIGEHNARYAGYLRLMYVQAAKKIPSSLFKAECKLEEYAQMQAEKKAFLKRKDREEIRKNVEARLLPQMPPQLKGFSFVYDPNSRLVYAEALSEKQADLFKIMFIKTLSVRLIEVTPETAAAERRKIDVQDWPSVSFSPDVTDEQVDPHVGQDFLTWLCFLSEERGGIVKIRDLGEFGVMLEGPVTFVMEGQGAHETVLRKGMPLLSPESKTCLQSGKKLRRARLTLARKDETWQVTLDADLFTFRGLKLPEVDEKDPINRFQERMLRLDMFKEVFLELYDRFLDERRDPAQWAKVLKDIHRWVADRRIRN